MYERIFQNKKTTFLALGLTVIAYYMVHTGKATFIEMAGCYGAAVYYLFSKDPDKT